MSQNVKNKAVAIMSSVAVFVGGVLGGPVYADTTYTDDGSASVPVEFTYAPVTSSYSISLPALISATDPLNINLPIDINGQLGTNALCVAPSQGGFLVGQETGKRYFLTNNGNTQFSQYEDVSGNTVDVRDKADGFELPENCIMGSVYTRAYTRQFMTPETLPDTATARVMQWDAESLSAVPVGSTELRRTLTSRTDDTYTSYEFVEYVNNDFPTYSNGRGYSVSETGLSYSMKLYLVDTVVKNGEFKHYSYDYDLEDLVSDSYEGTVEIDWHTEPIRFEDFEVWVS